MIVMAVGAMTTVTVADAQGWEQLGGAKEHVSGAGTDMGRPPLTLLYRTADGAPAVGSPVTAPGGTGTIVAYATADGRVHVRDLLSGAPVGPADGVLIDDGPHDADVFGTPEAGGGTISLATEAPPAYFGTYEGPWIVIAVHNDGDHIETAGISASTGELLSDVPVPGTAGLTLRSSPLVTESCRFGGTYGTLAAEGLYFVAGERLFRVALDATLTVTSVAVPGANALATPGVRSCYPDGSIVVSRTGGLSLFRVGLSLDGQTPQTVSLGQDAIAGTPTDIGGTLLVPVAENGNTTIVTVDPDHTPAVTNASPALPGTPGPVLARWNILDGVIAVGTTANLYVLNSSLHEIARFSPSPLPEDQAFGAVAPVLNAQGSPDEWRVTTERANGTPVALDFNGTPFTSTQLPLPDDLGTFAASGQPALDGGTVAMPAATGLLVYRDTDDDPPSGFLSVGTSDALSGKVEVRISGYDRQRWSAVIRSRPVGAATWTPFAALDDQGSAYFGGVAVTWDTTTVPDGEYLLGGRFSDPSGNATDSPTITVRVLNHPSVVSPPPALKPGKCANLRTGRSVRERLVGTAAGDRIRGFGGNDSISGGRGADCLEGNNGNDRLHGDAGNDRLSGGAGNDVLDGGSGANIISGGSGNDRVNAVNHAKDYISCGPGRDSVRAERRDHVSKDCERVRRTR